MQSTLVLSLSKGADTMVAPARFGKLSMSG
jgi:hypothetical protein